MDDAIVILLDVIVSTLVFTYWLAVFNSPVHEDAALIRDLCYLANSPEGTSLRSEYNLDLYIENGLIVTRVPVSSMCFDRLNETAILAPVVVERAMRIGGKIQLFLLKKNGKILVRTP
ncbi:MAG: hypothetical protein ACPLRJ_03935 [Infirmifilum uzonense]|uniref:hypothetical protein n=1 Tax=Infirmifilum uzonense TaxID=1550241 RepID=UPI003C73D2FC